MKQHPLSAAFPSMPETELNALVDDIASHGQREPGIVFDGMVLDGWHRYQATDRLGIEFLFVEFESAFPGKDPVAFVKSRNLHRRHLTDSQRAAAVVACGKWAPVGKPANVAPGATLATNADLAREADVSPRTIRHAKAAHAAGLGDAVRDGEISAKRAAEIAKASPAVAKKVARGEVTLPEAVKQIAPKKEQPKTEEPDLSEDEYGPSPEELTFFAEKEKADQEAYDALIEIAQSDDKLSEAIKTIAKQAEEIARLRALSRTLEESRNGKMNAINEHIQTIKVLRRKIEKLEKQQKAVA